MDVAVRGLYVPDHGPVRDRALASANDGDDVPVAELDPRVAGDQDRRRVQGVDGHAAGDRRVDRRAVRRRYVDAEVELAGLAVVGDTGIAEEPADGVLPVERLDRPAYACFSTAASRREVPMGSSACVSASTEVERLAAPAVLSSNVTHTDGRARAVIATATEVMREVVMPGTVEGASNRPRTGHQQLANQALSAL